MSRINVRRRGIMAYKPVAAPVGNKLLHSPPTLVSPTIWNVTNGDRSRSFNDNEDVQINLPGSALAQGSSGAASLQIQGGRNIIMRGGEISRSNQDLGSSPSVIDHYAIYLINNCGHVFMEGVYVHGIGVGQAIIVQMSRNDVYPKLTLQNCLLMAEHESTPGIHCDGVQIISGPDIFNMYNVTIRTGGTALQMQPYTGWTGHNRPINHFDFRKCDWVTQLPHSDTTPNSYGLTKASWGGQSAPWAEYHEDIWYARNLNHMWAAPPYYAAMAEANGSGWYNDFTGWNPGGIWPITGEAIKIGFRPGGDIVVPGVNCGVGYVSPGYL